MQEQRENNTDVVESEFDKLFNEAQELDVYIPTFVPKGYERLYKFAYLQVKKDPGCKGMSSAGRKS